MRRAFLAGILGLALAGAGWFGGPAVGQEAPAGSAWPMLEEGWEPPRTAWGVPDLTGIWDSKSSTPLERSDEHAGREFLTDEEVRAIDEARLAVEQGDEAQGRDVRGERGTQADVEGAYNNIFSTGLGVRYSRHRRTSLIVDPADGKVPAMTEEGAARQESIRQRFAARAAAAARGHRSALLRRHAGPLRQPGGLGLS